MAFYEKKNVFMGYIIDRFLLAQRWVCLMMQEGIYASAVGRAE
jgi:hypothetical protein